VVRTERSYRMEETDMSKRFAGVSASRRLCGSQSLLSDLRACRARGICIGIWNAKRYKHIKKGGWGN
jgi:hypothetical protein